MKWLSYVFYSNKVYKCCVLRGNAVDEEIMDDEYCNKAISIQKCKIFMNDSGNKHKRRI